MDLGEAAKWTLVIDLFEAVQGSRIRFVLGCVIPCAGAVARSRNLGQALFGSPVWVADPNCIKNRAAGGTVE